MRARARTGGRSSGADQIIFFKCLDLYHTSPNSGEHQYKSSKLYRQFDAALLRAGGTEVRGGALDVKHVSKKGSRLKTDVHDPLGCTRGFWTGAPGCTWGPWVGRVPGQVVERSMKRTSENRREKSRGRSDRLFQFA